MNDPPSIGTVLVVGITGSGKSTLCNCLLEIGPESDEAFRESPNARSETRHFKCKTIGRWKIMDTVGLGDTTVSPSVVYRDVAKACDECAKTGIAQILLVCRGRLTQEELDAFDKISRVLLDEHMYMWAHTTLIRTGFVPFMDRKFCAEDIEDMREHPVMKEFLPKIGNRVIHVDNQGRYDSSEWQVNRAQSREKVFNHLTKVTDQLPPYMPPRLQNVNDRIKEDLRRVREQEQMYETLQEQKAKFEELLQKKGEATEADLRRKLDLAQRCKEAEERKRQLEEEARITDINRGVFVHLGRAIDNIPGAVKSECPIQ